VQSKPDPANRSQRPDLRRRNGNGLTIERAQQLGASGGASTNYWGRSNA
jgi:hypothetical protein